MHKLTLLLFVAVCFVGFLHSASAGESITFGTEMGEDKTDNDMARKGPKGAKGPKGPKKKKHNSKEEIDIPPPRPQPPHHVDPPRPDPPAPQPPPHVEPPRPPPPQVDPPRPRDPIPAPPCNKTCHEIKPYFPVGQNLCSVQDSRATDYLVFRVFDIFKNLQPIIKTIINCVRSSNHTIPNVVKAELANLRAQLNDLLSTDIVKACKLSKPVSSLEFGPKRVQINNDEMLEEISKLKRYISLARLLKSRCTERKEQAVVSSHSIKNVVNDLADILKTCKSNNSKNDLGRISGMYQAVLAENNNFVAHLASEINEFLRQMTTQNNFGKMYKPWGQVPQFTFGPLFTANTQNNARHRTVHNIDYFGEEIYKIGKFMVPLSKYVETFCNRNYFEEQLTDCNSAFYRMKLLRQRLDSLQPLLNRIAPSSNFADLLKGYPKSLPHNDFLANQLQNFGAIRSDRDIVAPSLYLQKAMQLCWCLSQLFNQNQIPQFNNPNPFVPHNPFIPQNPLGFLNPMALQNPFVPPNPFMPHNPFNNWNAFNPMAGQFFAPPCKCNQQPMPFPNPFPKDQVPLILIQLLREYVATQQNKPCNHKKNNLDWNDSRNSGEKNSKEIGSGSHEHYKDSSRESSTENKKSKHSDKGKGKGKGKGKKEPRTIGDESDIL